MKSLHWTDITALCDGKDGGLAWDMKGVFSNVWLTNACKKRMMGENCNIVREEWVCRFRWVQRKRAKVRVSYLPGTIQTMITKVVGSGWGLSIAHRDGLTPATAPNRGGSSAKFLLVGLCVRADPLKKKVNRDNSAVGSLHFHMEVMQPGISFLHTCNVMQCIVVVVHASSIGALMEYFWMLVHGWCEVMKLLHHHCSLLWEESWEISTCRATLCVRYILAE